MYEMKELLKDLLQMLFAFPLNPEVSHSHLIYAGFVTTWYLLLLQWGKSEYIFHFHCAVTSLMETGLLAKE